MSKSVTKSRIVARKYARELTPREVEHVAGGVGGGNTQDIGGGWSDTNYN